ncbi:MAG TPA: TetR-like C-terminal domain-containing protein [Mycobacteriales bacterium]
MGEDGGRRGRPRDDTRDEAIRAAVLELLAEAGYTALTLDAVAGRARAGKATIYRRWPGKAELVVSAVAGMGAGCPPAPDTGTVRGDLLVFLSAVLHAPRGPLGAVATSVIGEMAHSPQLAAAFRAGPWRRLDETLDQILRRSAERGEVPADAPRDLVRELAGAALATRLVVTGARADDDFVRELVDGALLPLLGVG